MSDNTGRKHSGEEAAIVQTQKVNLAVSTPAVATSCSLLAKNAAERTLLKQTATTHGADHNTVMKRHRQTAGSFIFAGIAG